MPVPCAPLAGDVQIQLRKGTTAQNDAFTGASGELSFDTQENRIRVHDGVTVGGFRLAKASEAIGYSMQSVTTASTVNPADGTTVFYGSGNLPQVVGGILRLYIPKSGTLTRVKMFVRVGGTLASAEPISAYVRHNNTTDYAISTTITYNVASALYTATPNIVLVENDYIEFKIVYPVFVTNPTGVHIAFVVYIE